MPAAGFPDASVSGAAMAGAVSAAAFVVPRGLFGRQLPAFAAKSPASCSAARF
jgi:hypothetical protein